MEHTQLPPLRSGYSPPVSQQYTESEWQSKKPLIKQLYINLDKSLKETTKIMSEEHNFHPTRKMYVTRLDLWGFAKNCTKKRVSSLLRQKRERDAISKGSKLSEEGRVVDAQRIERYLRRTNKDMEAFVITKEEGTLRTDAEMSLTLAKIHHLDTPSGLAHSQRFPSVQPSTCGDYELNCPYRQQTKKFRLIERFPNGSTYEADSLEFRSYIAVDEERPCTQHCYCRQHELSKSFTFLVLKSPDKMDITFFSDDLYANLIGYPELKGLLDEASDQERTLNGLILLGHYHTLKMYMDALRLEVLQQTTQSLLLELELLVDGLLADGEVFKSFGYENLYENEFLDFKLWKMFQQDSFERDVSALEEGFYDADNDLDELSTPMSDQSFSEHEQAKSVIDEADIFADLPMSLPYPDSVCSNTVPPDEIKDVRELPPIPPGQLSTAYTYSELDQATKRGDEVGNLLSSDKVEPANGDRLFDKSLDIPLAKAAGAGHETIVRLLLDRGASPDGNGFTSLANAVEAGHKTIVRLLLNRGASPNGDGTLLAEAARAGHEPIVRLLLDRGASPDGNRSFTDWRSALISTSESLDTPLAEAARAGHEAIVRLLFIRGATIPHTPECMEVLVEIGRKVKNVKFDQNLVDTAMVAATALGRIPAMLRLLQRGADIRAMTCLGTTLSTVARHNNHRIIHWLLQREAVRSQLRFNKDSRSCRDPKRAQILRYFHKMFINQHVLMINAAQRSSTEFRKLGIKFENHRDTWDAGIETVRRLKSGERSTLSGTIAYLCVAKAISEALQSSGSYDYAEPFLQDLARWQLLFTHEADRDGYRDAIQSMWGISLDDIASSKGQVDPDVTECFQELGSILISNASKQFGFHGLYDRGFEHSQQAWKLRDSQTPSDIDFSNDISSLQDTEGSGQQVSETSDAEPPNLDIGSDPNCLRQEIRDDKSVVTDHVVVFLMMGALFAILLIFLQWLRNISSCASAVGISTLQERYRNLESYMGLKPQAKPTWVDEEIISLNQLFDFDGFASSQYIMEGRESRDMDF